MIRSTSLAFLLAALGSFTSASQLVDNLLAGKNQTLVVYGTSLTAGGKWVAETKAWLNTLNPGKVTATVINSGQSGKNSRVGLEKLDEVVIAKKPDTVIIEFAVNDAGKGKDPTKHVTVEESMRNLETIIDRIKAARPETEIIIQTMNPAWDAPNGNRSSSIRPGLENYYEGYRKVAAKRGLLLIDHNKNWVAIQEKDPELFKTYIQDGVHPTPDGSIAVTFKQIKESLAPVR